MVETTSSSRSGRVDAALSAASRAQDLRAPIFVDTGAWFAYFNQRDPNRDVIGPFIDETSVPLVTSTYVFDELLTLVQARSSHADAVRAGERLRDPEVVVMQGVTRADEDAAWHRFRERPDKTYSFTDCTSFVLMERLGIEHVLTTDGDFATEGFIDLMAPEA